MAEENPNAGEGQAAPDLNNPSIQEAIRKAVESEVTGLKSKNTELLGKLAKAQEGLRNWEGMDPQSVREIMQRFESDEEAKLMKEGKWDELANRRVKGVLESHSKKLEAAQAERDKLAKEAETYKRNYQRAVIDNAVARSVSGLQDGALAHVQRMVSDWYTVGDDGNIVPTQTAPINGKGEPVDFKSLRDYLLDAAPFYFPPSQGAGATAGKASGHRNLKRSQMNLADKTAFIREHGEEAYLQLPS